ncbi:Endoribonuclease L-PSP [Sodalis praecaptivus]|uniref:Endoribonuclease L-PSP n=1 Tax=Sodalis praecaptivus TaxID=1239307 RepID=W0HVQ9_9GAMM|nr:RidA family protein [Sodalis praecaptivus]AHF76602.1 Endoribonuclease L-PSP [Sodalis praecaptivus]
MNAPVTGASARPQGNYVAAKRHADVIYTAGMTPRRAGVLLLQGPVRADSPLEDYREAVTLACANALHAARARLTRGEDIDGVLSLTVFIWAAKAFSAHSRLADFASNYLAAELGTAGIGARAAVGVASLPGNAPVEIQLIATVSRRE